MTLHPIFYRFPLPFHFHLLYLFQIYHHHRFNSSYSYSSFNVVDPFPLRLPRRPVIKTNMNQMDSRAPDPTVPYTRPSIILVRKIIAHRDLNAKRKYPRVFFVDDDRLGQLKPQWWPIAMGLTSTGARPLPNNLLDEAIPHWREYLLPGAKLPAGFESCQKFWNKFVRIQHNKYRKQRVMFPHPPDMNRLSVEFEEPESEKEDSGDEEESALVFPDGPDGANVDVTDLAVDVCLELCDAVDGPEVAKHIAAQKAQSKAE